MYVDSMRHYAINTWEYDAPYTEKIKYALNSHFLFLTCDDLNCDKEPSVFTQRLDEIFGTIKRQDITLQTLILCLYFIRTPNDKQGEKIAALAKAIEELPIEWFESNHGLLQDTDPQSFGLFFSALSLSPLKKLSLQHMFTNPFSTEKMSLFAKYLEFMPNIQELALSHNLLGLWSAAQLAPIAKSLSTLHKLSKLDLTSNNLSELSDEAWNIFVNLIANLHALKYLAIFDNNLSQLNHDRRDQLAHALLSNPRSITLSMNHEDDQDLFWEKLSEQRLGWELLRDNEPALILRKY